MMFTVKQYKTAAGHGGVGAPWGPYYKSLLDLGHIWRLRTCEIALRKIDRSKKGHPKILPRKKERVKK